MKPGNNITIVSGSRLRRISEDGKRLLDQTMQEGTLVEHDTPAVVKGVIQAADKSKTAYMLEVKHRVTPQSAPVTLLGWCYAYEVTPGK